MNKRFRNTAGSSETGRRGFSLVEVVLAIGVLSLAIVALLGLFGPTMGSVKQVVDTNTATAAVSRINAYIHHEKNWDDVVAAIPSVLYVWQSQEFGESENAPPGPVEFRVGTHSNMQSDLNAGKLAGAVMIATFERSTVNNYNYGTVASQGYVPILISIYPVDPAQNAFASPGDVKAKIDPIFTYTAAKTRSM